MKVGKKLEAGQGSRLVEDFHTPGFDTEGEGRTATAIAGEEKERTEWRNQFDSCREEDCEAVHEKRRTDGNYGTEQPVNSPVTLTLTKKHKSIYTNANSIAGKLDELRNRVQSGSFDIVAVTESWAKEHVKDSELKIDGYTMYKKDRPASTGAKGGGVPAICEGIFSVL